MRKKIKPMMASKRPSSAEKSSQSYAGSANKDVPETRLSLIFLRQLISDGKQIKPSTQIIYNKDEDVKMMYPQELKAHHNKLRANNRSMTAAKKQRPTEIIHRNKAKQE